MDVPGNVLNMNGTNETSVPGVGQEVDEYDEEKYKFVIKACFIFVIMLCTILGNILSIAVIARTKSLRTPSGNFIISLAAADLMVGACVVPFSFVAATQGRWIFSKQGKFMRFLFL